MMNSCEFEQPLDLRLKALNLSISSCQQQHCLESKNNKNNNNNNISSRSVLAIGGSANSSASTSTNSLASHQSFSSVPEHPQHHQAPPPPSHAPFAGGLGPLPATASASYPPVPRSQHQVLAHQTCPQPQTFQPPPFPTPHYHHQLTPPSLNAYHHQAPPLPAPLPLQQGSSKQQHTAPSFQYQPPANQSPLQMHQHQRPLHSQTSSPLLSSQQRSTNTTIHCQPLNHQQPHPLASRFHSQPASLATNHQPPPPVGSEAAPLRLSQSTSSSTLSAPSISHPGSPLNQATNGQQQLTFPVKSFSVSSHHHLQAWSPSNSSFGSVPTSGSSCSGGDQFSRSSSLGDASQLSHLESSVQQAVMKATCRTTGAAYPPTTLTNSTKASHISFANQQHHLQHHVQCDLSAPQHQAVVTIESAPPITRQHSLVSRYNCKPCGIVFSQPETLRAHQEGYCTKRERAQSQIRSQSAVSPGAVVSGQHTSQDGTLTASGVTAQPANRGH